MSVRILRGDVRDRLRDLPDESVHCVVTSPPYWGLRDYGHAGQIGMESTPDAFVGALVQVFAEVRRVLREDGTLWVNMGDSYAAQRGGTAMPAETLAGGVGGKGDEIAHRGRRPVESLGGRRGLILPEVRTFAVAHRNAKGYGLKHKDLVGVPWRLAFALQSDGWYLRQDIIWSKPNPMPESVRDRCTKAHEYIFLLAKSERYYYDQDAIMEEAVCTKLPGRNMTDTRETYGEQNGGNSGLVALRNKLRDQGETDPTRNKRSVWTVVTQAYKEAHFATFPPALIEPCILAGCPVGGTVLDPFGGAGTTGLVADRLQRDAILIELNPDYAAMAEKRIRGESPMFADVRVA